MRSVQNRIFDHRLRYVAQPHAIGTAHDAQMYMSLFFRNTITALQNCLGSRGQPAFRELFRHVPF